MSRQIEITVEVIKLLRDNDSLSAAELADIIGTKPETVRRNLDVMMDLGVADELPRTGPSGRSHSRRYCEVRGKR